MKSMLKSLMSVAAAALALTSCSNDATEEVILNGGSKTLEVNATIEETRTVMAADHVNLEWAAGDQIHLYIGADATVANDIDPVTGGKITGVTYNENDKVYAYYSLPDDTKSSTGATNALINIIDIQTQSAASVFAGENLPMVASSSIVNGKVNLVFKPVGCVLVFNVYGQGMTADEKIQSIKFETTVGCYGYDFCDLTAENLGYTAYSSGKSATVKLTEPAAIAAAKPTDTKIGENQVYLVVAPVNYPAGSKFTVTTDANNAYTFTTTTALDCSAKTARVVNLNLAKSDQLKSAIKVSTTSYEVSPDAGDNVVEGIEFVNIATDGLTVKDAVSVYSDAGLTQPGADWLTIRDNNTELFTSGKLHYTLAANETTTPRTAYIVIDCGGVESPAIAITQLAKGSTVVEYDPSKANHGDKEKVSEYALDGVTLAFAGGSTSTAYYVTGESLRCYGGSTITVKSGDKISKIVITRGTGDKGNTLIATSGGTLSEDTLTWTGESNEVVLTVSGTSGHIRIASMKITYIKGSGGGEQPAPTIEVPTVDKQPAEGGSLAIDGIVFKNIDDVTAVTAGVYSDTELTQPLDGAWLQITSSAELANGKLSCAVAANETSEERTAYIGIKYEATQVAQAVITITQKGKGVPDPTVATVNDIVTSASYQAYDENENWIVTCGGNNHTLGSNANNDSNCTLKGNSALAAAMGLTVSDRAAAVISKKLLPAGYNTAKLEYSKTNTDMSVGIAFSTDNVTWTKIMDFVELKESATVGSQTYSFPQQEAGYYAFVATGNKKGMRIQTCVITYSQSQQ